MIPTRLFRNVSLFSQVWDVAWLRVHGDEPRFCHASHAVRSLCTHFSVTRARATWLKNAVAEGHAGTQKVAGSRWKLLGMASFLGGERRQVDGVNVYFKGGVIYFPGRTFIQLERVI